jgi:phytoene dehydrogenase-like protein
MKADVLVVGGGVNGLTTAALLAKAGRRPLVLEARGVVGGCAVTEEFHPGFRASTVAHLAGPFRAGLVRDLGLAVEFVESEPRLYAPAPDGEGLALYGDAARTAAGIARLSPKDAKAWPEFAACLARIGPVLSRVLDMTPPDIDTPRLGDAFPLLGLGLGFRGLGRKDATRVLRWGPMAVADFVAEWFESERLRAALAGRGIWGAAAGPWSAGTTTQFLLLTAQAGGNAAGSAVHVKGGLGALTGALGEAVKRAGGTLRTGARVERFTVKDGRVSGVVLAGGEAIEAGAVVSALDPQKTFLSLLDPTLLDPDDARRLRNYRAKGMASKVNLALSGLPTFAGSAAGDPSLLRGRIHIGPSIDDLEHAYDDGKYGRISKRPYLDVTIPTLIDPGLAPSGQHVLSVYVQFTPYTAKGEAKEQREEVAEVTLSTLEAYAPGLRKLVVGKQVLLPRDLEAEYGVTGGHPLHGEPSLDQLFVTRPVLGLARYRAPLAGLFLCGAGTHPGGGVTGGPGQNAAAEILKALP